MAEKTDEGRKQALRVARTIGCSGAHQKDGKWFPCKDHDKLLEISRRAESGRWTPPDEKKELVVSADSVFVKGLASNRKKRKKKRDGWEELREAPVRSVETLPSGGLVSGKGALDPGRVGGWMDVLDEVPEPKKKRRKRRTTRLRLEEVERRRAGSIAVPGSDMSVKKDTVDGDGDGRVYDGTAKERPATPAEIARGRTRRIRKASRALKKKPKKGGSRRSERRGDSIRVYSPSGRRDRDTESRVADQIESLPGSIADRRPLRGFTVTNKEPARRGRKAKKVEQELTPESRRLRTANQRAFPRSVTPTNLSPEVSVAEIRDSTAKDTAAHFGIVGRGIDQLGVSPERREVYRRIAESMVYGDSDNPRDLPKPEKPTAYLMGGGPGSGKSFLRQAGFSDVPSREEAAHIDTDEGRRMLPEYDSMMEELTGAGEGVVAASEAVAGLNHEEASYVARLATDMAIGNGHDVVVDSTGDGGPDSFTARLRQVKEAGYRVEAHYTTVSIKKAMETAEKRAKEEGRGVSRDVIEDTHIDVSRAIIYGIGNGLFDHLTLTDNEDHDNPVVFAEMVNGRLKIYNSDMWDRFASKATQETKKSYEIDYFVNNTQNDEILRDLMG